MFEEEKRHGQVLYRMPCAIGNYLRAWQMNVSAEHPLAVDPREFLESMRPCIRGKLTEEILALDGVKFQLVLKVSLRKQGRDGTEEFTDPVLRHKQKALLQASEIKGALDEAIPHFLELLEKWTQRGSGWTFDRVQSLWLDIARYQPLRGSSYIPLPAAVRSKKAIVNVKNKDDHCFRWTLRPELLMRKGVYPYEYMGTWDRFTEPNLSQKEAFYSKLVDAYISDEDYTHAQKV